MNKNCPFLSEFTILIVVISFLWPVSSIFSAQSGERINELNPSKTRIIIIGVLQWKEKELTTFSSSLRKDVELYDTLASLGVPKSKMALLIDEEATLTEIRKTLKETIAMTASDETLIFYYAGHGLQYKKEVYFVNYDANTNKALETGFSLSELQKSCKQLKGQVLLMADCCYSGELGAVASKLSLNNVKAASASSAEACNESTQNWTFTQTLIDVLKGSSISDLNSDGKITLKEFNLEVRESMRHREKQKSGFSYHGITEDYVMSSKTVESKFSKMPRLGAEEFKRGNYVLAENSPNEPSQCGRIIGGLGKKLLIRFYNYNKSLDKPISVSKVYPSTFESFPKKAEIRVMQNGKEWDAIVIDYEDQFHLVTYPGWGAEWNEWIMSDRIICLKNEQKNRRKCEVSWHGAWYGAEVYRARNDMYRIHYAGHSSNWDEWVGESRIRFKE